MSARATRGGRRKAFEAFLSHRYKSPEVNQYFFELFEPLADVQFHVDTSKFPINVTRLERRIRSADAFVGLYPFPREPRARPTREALLEASRYFRLELDLATRSRCPAIVFVDKAYGPSLPIPASMMQCPFDSAEILGSGGSPNAGLFSRRFADFFEMVAASMQSRHVFDRGAPTPNLVGLLLPRGTRSRPGYSGQERQLLRGLLEEHNFTVQEIDWQSPLDAPTLARLDALDFAVTDIGDWPPGGLVPYMHGRFVPTLRLRRAAEGQGNGALERALFGDIKVGYVEDVVTWERPTELEQRFRYRLHTLTLETRRIETSVEARRYFQESARLTDGIFLSYSGRDHLVAERLSAALQSGFQRVFDYRDGKSIQPGQPWMDEIYESLGSSTLGVPVISPSYLASPHCLAEARFITQRAIEGRMAILPILARPAEALPKWLSQHQYVPLSQLDEPSKVLDMAKSCLKRSRAS